ncbi:hypothetical protein M8C21_011549 [Ambrosia artemisiifolia]|uniref:eIF-4F 25 kDa subunit n=1 Tax=Ambrosia artemisiifolia TaxID=4212 RepID=A0AAD5C2N2_AMBAR|nr:hypothetical protein M8C21_011549 [Ambrosia artemisiifolia]
MVEEALMKAEEQKIIRSDGEEGEIIDGDTLSSSSSSSRPGTAVVQHPLEQSWTFWFDNPSAKQKQAAWGSSMRPIYTFSTAEEFWSLYNNIHRPGKLAPGADFYCFKNKIEPKWEDPVCANGGKWTMTFAKSKSDTCWLYTLLAMIGEQFDHGDDVCGAVVNVRARQEKISLWTKNAANENAQISIGKQWKEFLDYNDNIGFIFHEDAKKLDRGAKNKYTVISLDSLTSEVYVVDVNTNFLAAFLEIIYFGPHKRRPAKNKKKAKRSGPSTTPHPRHGESDNDLLNAPYLDAKMESMEGSSSGYESLSTDITHKAAKEEQAEIQIDKEPNIIKQTKIEMDEAAKVEPATVADYLSRPSESSPDKETPKVEDLGFKTPPTGDPVTPVDQSLVEVASKLNNDLKIQENDDLVAAETLLEHTVIDETDPNNNQFSKEIEVQTSGSKSNKASPKSEENSLQDFPNGNCRHCGRSSDDRVNELVTPECSEKQPLLASAPPPSERASWKNCCGIFELFSGSTSR